MQWHHLFQVGYGTFSKHLQSLQLVSSWPDMALQRPSRCRAELQGLSWVLPGSTFPPDIPHLRLLPSALQLHWSQAAPSQGFKGPEKKKSNLAKSTAAVGLPRGFQLLKAMGPEAHPMVLAIEMSSTAQQSRAELP